MAQEVEFDSKFQVRKILDKRLNREVTIIMPGQHFVSREPVILYTVLGACVSVCIRDTVTKVGGINHFLLPAPKISHKDDSWDESDRYGSYAMDLLINDILKLGGRRERLEVKVFGGAKIHKGEVDLGASTAGWILKYLHKEGLPPLKKDLGNSFPRKIYYFSDSGRVLMKRIKNLQNDTIIKREERYKKYIQITKQTEWDVTLFKPRESMSESYKY